MTNLPIIKFRLNSNKQRGVYSFFVITMLCSIGLITLSQYLTFRHGLFLVLLGAFFSILMFIFSIFAIIRMRKDGDVGLIISNEGVTDLSTGYNIGVVLWKDIEKIKVMDDLDSDRKYLVLVVRNPNQYIMQEATSIKKRSLTLKMHYYGSPICISTRGLRCTFEELQIAVENRYEAFVNTIMQR